MIRLRRLLRRGLRATARLWPPIRAAYAWVDRAAAILANPTHDPAAVVRRRFHGLLGALTRAARRVRIHRGALRHFLKVTRSYWPGLFATYDIADLPRTNNDLEHVFGAHRYHERRASGRKGASPSLVVRGSVRLVAAATTRVRPVTDATALAPSDVTAWRTLRASLERRAAVRTLGRQFRRHPEIYLATLEDVLLKQTLPP